jgi:hypothetical protein
MTFDHKYNANKKLLKGEKTVTQQAKTKKTQNTFFSRFETLNEE